MAKPKTEQNPNGAGAPEIEFTKKQWSTLKKLCAIFCTLEEAAGVMGVAKGTLLAILKRERDQTWQQFFEEHSSNGKMALRRAQLKSAILDRNPTAQIWLGKQYLDQKDKHELGFDPNQPVVFTLKMGKDLTKQKEQTDDSEESK